jgi:hypothetical protein
MALISCFYGFAAVLHAKYHMKLPFDDSFPLGLFFVTFALKAAAKADDR